MRNARIPLLFLVFAFVVGFAVLRFNGSGEAPVPLASTLHLPPVATGTVGATQSAPASVPSPEELKSDPVYYRDQKHELSYLTQILPGLPVCSDWALYDPDSVTVQLATGAAVFRRVSYKTDYAGRKLWVGRQDGSVNFYVASGFGKDYVAVVGTTLGSYSVQVDSQREAVRVVFDDRPISCPPTSLSAASAAQEQAAPLLDGDQVTPSPSSIMAATTQYTVDLALFLDEASLAAEAYDEQLLITKMVANLGASNQEVVNSQITNFQWKLNVMVVVPATDYTFSNDMSADLPLMHTAGNALYTTVQNTLTTSGSDEAMLLVTGGGNWGGLAYVSWKYGVTRYDQLFYRSMTHEMGHNFGSYHDRITDNAVGTSQSLYYYGYMFRDAAYYYWYDVNPPYTGDIMAYASHRMPYFANPSVLYNYSTTYNGVLHEIKDKAMGVPVGQADQAYSARYISENAARMAGYNTTPHVHLTYFSPSRTVNRGGNTSLLAYTSEDAAATFQWYKDGVLLPGASQGSLTLTAVTQSQAGNYSVRATINGQAITSGSCVLTVAGSLAAQAALAIVATPSPVSFPNTSALSTTGGTGTGLVAYSLVSGPATLSGLILTPTGVGTVVVRATKAADAAYSAVTSPDLQISINPGAASLQGTLSYGALLVGGGATPTMVPVATNGTITYASGNTAVATVNASTGAVTGVSQGSCVITATLVANSNYAGVSTASATLVVSKAAQAALSLLASPSSVAFPNTVSLSSQGGSGTGLVSFVLVSGPATLSGASLAPTATGTLVVHAVRAADASYSAATSADVSVVVSPGAASMLGSLSYGALLVGAVANPSSVPSVVNGSLSFSSGNTLVATVNSSTGAVSAVGEGSCNITATLYPNSNYSGSGSSVASLVVSKGVQAALSVLATPNPVAFPGSVSLGTQGGSGSGLVSYTLVSGPATLSGSTLSPTGAGTLVVRATKAADSSFAAKTSSDLSIVVNPGAASLQGSLAYGPLSVGGSSSPTMVPVSTNGSLSYSSSNTAVATVHATNGTVTGLAEGSCTISVTLYPSSNYSGSGTASSTLSVSKSSQSSFTLLATPSVVIYPNSVGLSTQGGSGTGAVYYDLVSGPGTLSGATLNPSGTGTLVVRATKDADSVYASVVSPNLSIIVNPGPAVLQGNLSYGAVLVGSSANPVMVPLATNGSISYSSSNASVATVNASTGAVIAVSEGVCTISASLTPALNYTGAGLVTTTVSVTKSSQAFLSVVATPAVATYPNSIALATQGGSGMGALVYSLVSGPATLSGSTLTPTGTGVLVVRATKAGDANYTAITSADLSVTVNAGTASLQGTLSYASVLVGATASPVTAPSASNGLVSYSSSTPTVATVNSATGMLTALSEGSSTISASLAPNANYSGTATISSVVIVVKNPQPSLSVLATPSAVAFPNTISLAVQGGGGTGTVAYTLVSGAANLSGALLTPTGVGTLVVRAIKAADSSYTLCTSPDLSITVNPGLASLQGALSYGPLLVGSSLNPLMVPVASNGTIAYASSDPSIATVNSASGAVTAVSNGVCTITGTLSAQANYAGTASVSTLLTVSKSLQSSFSVVATPSALAFPGSVTLSTQGGNGAGTISFALVSGPANLAGAIVTPTGVGTVVVHATKAADALFASVTSPDVDIAVGPGAASLQGTLNYALVYLGATGVPASIPSATNGSVVYASSAPSIATVDASSGVVTAVTAGTCTISATLVPFANYSGASSVSAPLTVSKLSQSALSVVANPASVSFPTSVALSAQGGQGTGSVSYFLVSGPATLSGSTLIPTGPGTLLVHATKAADATYTSVTSPDLSIAVTPGQASLQGTLSYPALLVGATAAPLTQPSVSNGSISYASSNTAVATVNASTGMVTAVAEGVCQITGSLVANTNFSGTGTVVSSLTVAKSAQASFSLVASPSTVAFPDTVSLSSQGGSGGGAVSFSLISGPATLAGSTLTPTGTGNLIVRATKAADANYTAVIASDLNITVNPGLATLRGDFSYAALVVGDSGAPASHPVASHGSVVYSSENSSIASVDSSTGTVSALAVGSCVITATLSASTNYSGSLSMSAMVSVSAKPLLSQAITVSPGSSTIKTGQSLVFTVGGSHSLVRWGGTSGASGTGTSQTLSFPSEGSYTVSAQAQADATYGISNQVVVTVVVVPSSTAQAALTASVTPNPLVYPNSATLSAQGGSGTGGITYTLVSGPATLSGSTLTPTGTGRVAVRATKAADENYTELRSPDLNVAINPGLASLQGALSYRSLLLGEVASPELSPVAINGAISYASSNPAVAAVDAVNGSVTAYSVGACTITATLSATAFYEGTAGLSATVSVTSKPLLFQSISVSPLASTIKVGQSVVFTVAGNQTAVHWGGTSGASGTGITQTVTFPTSGSYTVTAQAEVDSTYGSSALVVATVLVSEESGPKARLINISTRSMVKVGAEAQVAGFVISGTEPKKVLIRAGGPALAQFGLTGFLKDPFLTLYDQDQKVIFTNDTWDAASIQAVAKSLGAYDWTLGSTDAALLVSLKPGLYTAAVSDVAGGSGIGLVEIYDAEPQSSSKLVNISTRSLADAGSQQQIVGFVISGTGSKRVLIRAGGPALAGFSIPGYIPDPTLVLYDKDGKVLATNEDWDALAIQTIARAIGAYAWTIGSKDAALAIELPVGLYTAGVAPQGSTPGGIDLIEVYDADP